MFLAVSLPIVVFEVLAYACLGLCIWHVLKQGPLRSTRLINPGVGVLSGLTLETLTGMAMCLSCLARYQMAIQHSR
jgi:hypothetical protein